MKKKSGFPVRRMLLCASDMAQKIHDEGLADVFIGGNGITGKIHLETSSSKHDVFDVCVHCSSHAILIAPQQGSPGQDRRGPSP